MTRIALLMLGALAAVVFAAVVLVAVPRAELASSSRANAAARFSRLKPYTEAEARGRAVYIANGCLYCHSQQVRDPAITIDQKRGWGRPSYPSDYIFDRPALLGTMRTGPDLINVGTRLPDRTWHLLHLYQPRAVVPWSIMPSYPFLFRTQAVEDPANYVAPAGEEVVRLPEQYALSGRIVIATPAARDLVTYLQSLRRDFEPVELRPVDANEQGGPR
jgi:cytochrome c oxidase cbb3-type subunit II